MCEPRRRPRLELAEVVRRFGAAYMDRGGVPGHHMRTLGAIRDCRTSKLGGHMLCCTTCGSTKISYNSCRNRHCPKCGGLAKELWIEDRKRELLPVRYQHLVFTIPHQINDLCRYNARFCYRLLFRTAWSTLDAFGRDPKWLGARIGATMVLHTWGQNLSLHPHVHCIVPSGGLGGQEWVEPKRGKAFLFPVKAMSKVFRGRFLTALRKAWLTKELVVPPGMPTKEKAIKEWCRKRWRQDWVVYAKPPFKGPDTVVEYLGRYTHKTAISNHRLVAMDEQNVTFQYKDYRQNGKRKLMTLNGLEFLRRFCQHILPSGFVRIRHYGILANVHKEKALMAARRSLDMPDPPPKEERKVRVKRLIEKLIDRGLDDCADCGAVDSLVRILIPPDARAPPKMKFNQAGV
ncbi:MAG: IS91 family transposase [Bacteroidota bacterium]